MSKSSLVLSDYREQGWDALQGIIDKLGDAFEGVEDLPDVLNTRGEPKKTKRILFDDSKARDTHVHGWGANAGYIVHIDSSGHWYTR